MDISKILFVSILAILSALALFWILCLIFRRRYAIWDQDNEEQRFSAIKYHNEAIYKDFTFFIKVTLAVVGGVVYLVTKSSPDKVLVDIMLTFAGFLQFLIGLIFSFFIIFHQKSKIERWKEKPPLLHPFTWQECWMVVTMILISVDFSFVFLPALMGS